MRQHHAAEDGADDPRDPLTPPAQQPLNSSQTNSTSNSNIDVESSKAITSGPVRVASPNACTRSRFRGVIWNSVKQQWQLELKHDGGFSVRQWFADEADAARAYDRVARQIVGPNAPLNFPSVGDVLARAPTPPKEPVAALMTVGGTQQIVNSSEYATTPEPVATAVAVPRPAAPRTPVQRSMHAGKKPGAVVNIPPPRRRHGAKPWGAHSVLPRLRKSMHARQVTKTTPDGCGEAPPNPQSQRLAQGLSHGAGAMHASAEGGALAAVTGGLEGARARAFSEVVATTQHEEQECMLGAEMSCATSCIA